MRKPAGTANDRERHPVCLVSVTPRRNKADKSTSGARDGITGGKMYLAEVADDGPGMIDATRLANGHGVGIRNTRERLQVLYGERGAVAVIITDPGCGCR